MPYHNSAVRQPACGGHCQHKTERAAVDLTPRGAIESYSYDAGVDLDTVGKADQLVVNQCSDNRVLGIRWLAAENLADTLPAFNLLLLTRG